MKIGTKVKWTRRNGELATGKTVTDEYEKGRGNWIDVTMVDEKNKPVGKTFCLRPSTVTKL